jgi:Domain of unknown function DUF87.
VNLIHKNKKKLQSEKKEEKGDKKQKLKPMLIDKKQVANEKTLYKLPKSIQETIPILKISQQGLFEIGHNRYDKAYLFHDTNYFMMDMQEQEELFLHYCTFLNSMGVKFKIQIANHNKDMEIYQEELLIRENNDGFNDLRQAYNECAFEKIKDSRKGIEQFKYIIIETMNNNYEMANAFFINLEATLKSYFSSFGSVVIPLNAEERLRPIFNSYNFGKEKFFSFNWDEAVSVGFDWKNDIAGTYFKINPSHIQLRNAVCSTLFIKNYPSVLKDGFLKELTSLPINTVTTIRIHPRSKEYTQKLLDSKYMSVMNSITKLQEARNKRNQISTDIPYSKRRAKKEIEEMLREVDENDAKMFEVAVTVMIYARDKEELDNHAATIKSLAEGESMIIDTLSLCQLEGFKDSLAIGGTYTRIKRELLTQSLGAFIPFNVQELNDQSKDSISYGINQISKNPLQGDRKVLANGNGFIFGASGFGKSLITKMEMGQVFLKTEDDIIVIDPMNEYFKMAKKYKATVVNISPDTEHHLNPFESPKKEQIGNIQDFISRKAEFLLSVCARAMDGSLNSKHKSIIDHCIGVLYNDFFMEKLNETTWKEFYAILEEQQEEEAVELALCLRRFVHGSLNIFAHKTNVDMNNRFIVFGTKELGEELRPLSMLVLIESIRDRIVKNAKMGKRTRLYVDEVHNLTLYEDTARYLEKIYKEIRKEGGLVTGITQNVGDLLLNETTKNMLANSEFWVFLKQSPTDVDNIKEALHLSDTQLGFVSKAQAGLGILKFGNNIIPFDNEIPKESLLYELYNTDPAVA